MPNYQNAENCQKYCQKYCQYIVIEVAKILPKLLSMSQVRISMAPLNGALCTPIACYAHKHMLCHAMLCTQTGHLLLLFRACKVDIGKWRGNLGIEEELSPHYHTATTITIKISPHYHHTALPLLLQGTVRNT